MRKQPEQSGFSSIFAMDLREITAEGQAPFAILRYKLAPRRDKGGECQFSVRRKGAAAVAKIVAVKALLIWA
jgi:hypothetical protein